MSVSPFSAPLSPVDPSTSAGEPPFVTVIVPIRNEERFIGQTLSELVDQDYDPERFEVIVIDGCSDDGTKAVVQRFVDRYPHVRLLDNPRQWSSAARNLGVLESRGDYLLVIDAHCELKNRHYLAQLVEAFQTKRADCVGRPQPLDVTGASLLQEAIAAARASRLGHHPASYIYSDQDLYVPAHSVAVAYRREVFEELGLFDQRFDACEDVEFNHRIDQAGYRCFLAASLRVTYHPRATLRQLARQMHRYGRGRGRLLRKHRDTFSWGSLLPALFVAGLLVGPWAAWASPWLAGVYGAAVGTYLAAVVATSAALAARHPRSLSMFARLVAVFVTVHLAAGAGVLQELLLGPIFHPLSPREGAQRLPLDVPPSQVPTSVA